MRCSARFLPGFFIFAGNFTKEISSANSLYFGENFLYGLNEMNSPGTEKQGAPNEKRNFWAFVWHAVWLALAQTFADRNTVLPGLILLVGGTKTHLGILTAILIGLPVFSQLLFAAYLSQKKLKKKFLLLGIYLRVFAFGGVAWTLSLHSEFSSSTVILLVYVWMLLFTISGAFAGVSYTDVLGKSIKGDLRKNFLVVRQLLSSIGVLISALAVRQILQSFDYPKNYEIAFEFAFVLLFIASLGFIAIKEKPTQITGRDTSLLLLIKSIPSVIKKDKNLKSIVIISNLIGFSISLIPFYISLVKDKFHLDKSVIGNLLLLQIIGMIASNWFWSKIVKKKAFKGVLFFDIVLEGTIPLLAISLAYFGSSIYFPALFFLIGTALSAHKIAFEGVLLEISTDENRALYSGVFGALSLTIAIFPLLAGYLISSTGYVPVLAFSSIIVFSSLLFYKNLKCN